MGHTGQILHSDTTGTGSVSGLTIELYEDEDGRYVVELVGTPIVAYAKRDEAAGVFYLLSQLSAETLTSLMTNAIICDVFPVQS